MKAQDLLLEWNNALVTLLKSVLLAKNDKRTVIVI
jgi:hypothetical protein